MKIFKLIKNLFTREVKQYYYETASNNDSFPNHEFDLYIYKTSNTKNKQLLDARWFERANDRNKYIIQSNLLPLIYTCGCQGVKLFEVQITKDSLSSSKHWKICRNCLKEKLDAGAIAIM
jgi:hypothetical protein